MYYKMSDIIQKCPNCNLYVLILKNELNCRIFRHGVLKSNMTQINPHMPKNQCDELKRMDLIYGCGKPFRYVNNKLEICGYI